MYFGLKAAGFGYTKWLDLVKLSESLLKPDQEINKVKYFTSRVGDDPEKQKRQTTYIEALESTGVEVYYGQYQRGRMDCNRCGHVWPYYSEKMTDVNIAVQIIIDAFKDEYDMAMLVSGDSDLVPPIKAVHENFKQKRVFVAFPPKRHNASVALVAKGSLVIGRRKLSDSQLPDEITKANGYVLKKPQEWCNL